MNWTTTKPEFTEDCLLITASWYRDNWNYTFYEIERRVDFDKKWYWGIFQDGDEWGDIADLKADRYLILPKIH